MIRPRIFVSHQWKYSEDYYSLKKKFNDLGWNHHDYSVPEHDPLNLYQIRQIENQLFEQIRQCNFFICFARIVKVHK
jgi:hypothetical protein